MRRRTGISLAAHSMRSLPRAARKISLTSPLIEVVINNVILSFCEKHCLYYSIIFSICSGSSGMPVGVEMRSEEHTSELQSHSDLVCRLLLEKKRCRSCKRRQTACR